MTFASLAGYALARLRFRGAQALTGVVLLTYLVPSALLFIPLYQILSRFHLINTLGSLIITYPTFALALRDVADDGLLPQHPGGTGERRND